MKFIQLLILSGEMEVECITLDEDVKIVKSRSQVDLRETLRRFLYGSGLDDVRTVLEYLPVSVVLTYLNLFNPKTDTVLEQNMDSRLQRIVHIDQVYPKYQSTTSFSMDFFFFSFFFCDPVTDRITGRVHRPVTCLTQELSRLSS
jgi:hypothetical protein